MSDEEFKRISDSYYCTDYGKLNVINEAKRAREAEKTFQDANRMLEKEIRAIAKENDELKRQRNILNNKNDELNEENAALKDIVQLWEESEGKTK